MIILRTLFILSVLFAGVSHAQERAAAQPFNMQGDVTNTELLQKVSYLQQMVRVLEEQVRNCGGASGSSSGDSSASLPDDSEGFSPGRADEGDE